MTVHPDQFYDEDVYAKFEADIPNADDQETILTVLSEAVSGYEGNKEVTVLESWASDVINHTGSGYITWKGEDYSFHLESGNNRGTVLLEWEGVGREYKEPVPIQYTLQPVARLVVDAIAAGKGPFLVFKWDAMVKNLDLMETLRKYLYDRHFSPTIKITEHYRAIFAKHQVEVVEQEEADATRARLMAATANDKATNYWPEKVQ